MKVISDRPSPELIVALWKMFPKKVKTYQASYLHSILEKYVSNDLSIYDPKKYQYLPKEDLKTLYDKLAKYKKEQNL